jgi:hypothetical protein
MCTVSVITGDDQYLLGMNRDEKLSRGKADGPVATERGQVRMLFPRDVEGGTWIAVNEYGNGFALLNWHAPVDERPASAKSQSRGHVIPHVASAGSLLEEVEQSLTPEFFEGMLPFRLIGVFPKETRLVEWRWNLHALEAMPYDWAPRHWFSSGLSDQSAEENRGGVCAQAWLEESAGSVEWLRRLHASHGNGPGPFSVCVHRESVGTLSYTEIDYRAGKSRLTYIEGSPCAPGAPVESTF